MKIIDVQFQGIPGAIAAFLLESTKGAVLIETGPHSTRPQLESSLQQSGYKLADVQHVLLPIFISTMRVLPGLSPKMEHRFSYTPKGCLT